MKLQAVKMEFKALVRWVAGIAMVIILAYYALKTGMYSIHLSFL